MTHQKSKGNPCTRVKAPTQWPAWAQGLAAIVTLIVFASGWIAHCAAPKATTSLTWNNGSVEITDSSGVVTKRTQVKDETDWRLVLHAKPMTRSNLLYIEKSGTTDNELVHISDRGEIISRSKIAADDPWGAAARPLPLKKIVLTKLDGRNYFLCIAYDNLFPAAILLFDERLNELARVWHPGHIYHVHQAGPNVVGWGKSNAFHLQAESQTLSRAVTEHHNVVFSLRLRDLLVSGAEYIAPHGARKTTPLVGSSKSPFTWYYIEDRLTSEYKLQSLLSDGIDSVVFQSDTFWSYKIIRGEVVNAIEDARITTEKPARMLQVLPIDGTAEVSP